jgi:hypothetical protein
MNFLNATDITLPANAKLTLRVPPPLPGTQRYFYNLIDIVAGIGQPANFIRLNGKPLARNAISTTGTVASSIQTARFWPLFFPVGPRDALDITVDNTGAPSITYDYGTLAYQDQAMGGQQ